MSKIIKEILKNLPDNKISDAVFEGANIVLYTKDKDFFLNNSGMIKDIVNMFKKRVELRPDPSIVLDPEKAKKDIEKIIPEEAKMDNMIFDPQRSMVVIEAEKPGLVIGKQGAVLREIKEKTMWVPLIKRTPAIRSQLIENIRSVLYENSDERRKFLNKVGHRVYDGWIRGKKEEWVRITYLGSGRQVGRSSMLLQTPESRILLDCGMDVANEAKAYPFLEAPEFSIQDLDAVIVSHAHLDHCALIPYLIKYGYEGPIYCTTPTRDVMALLQLDFIKIQRGDGKEPMYSSDEVKKMVMQTIPLDYEEVTDITPDIRITLYNAGHNIGSSMVHLHIGNGLHNLLYGADMKYGKTQLLDPAVTKFPRLESLMIEATYGGRTNNLPTREEDEATFSEIVSKTIERKGKVLVPVLGVGRSQEIMIILERMIREKKIPDVPIYIDGMVWDVTAIHTAYPEYLNSQIRNLIFHKNHNPFLSECFKRVGSAKERQQVIEEGEPCVILATSGMLTGGPSVQYLQSLGSFSKNSLIFVSYQGEGSLGKRIQRGEREIMFSKNELLKIGLEIFTIEGFTGHSGRQELMNFVKKCTPRPKKVLINHGESSRVLDLASSIHKTFRIETVAPRNLESIRLR